MKRNKFVRDNTLSEEEFRQLMKACKQIDNSIANKYLVLAIMGGCSPWIESQRNSTYKGDLGRPKNSKEQNKLGGVE